MKAATCCRADDCEVAAVEGGDRCLAESLRQRDQRRVGTPQAQVSVLLHEIGATCEVPIGGWLDPEAVTRQRADKSRLCRGPTRSFDHECGLRGDERRDDERTRGSGEKFPARLMIGILPVRRGDQGGLYLGSRFPETVVCEELV